jgi:hypothetical protein
MQGSSVEYIIQYRLQDYWLDVWAGTYLYRNTAEERLRKIKQEHPETDYKLIKRTHIFEDIEL